MSPVLGRPPRAPRSRPVKPGAQAPGVGKGTTASGKPTGAPRATGPDEARRTTRGHGARLEARRRPQPRHTDRCQATTAAGCGKPGERAQQATNHGTGTGAKQHQLPSGWTSARPEGTQALPPTNSRRPDGRVRGRRVSSPYRLRTAAVRMDECAPGGYPAPTCYEQLPSGWTSQHPAATPRPRNTTRATQSTAHRASTRVYRSQAAQDTVHATQPTERAHR